MAATLFEAVCLETIALIEAGLRGVRKTLARLRGGIAADDAADVAPPVRDGDQVGRAPSARPQRDTNGGEPPRVVGRERPPGAPKGDSDVADVAHDAPPAAEHAADAAARALPALLARGDALPSAYGDDRVVLLARDPFCLFAYWDLAPARWRAVESAAGGDRVRGILRVSDVTQIPFTGAGAVRHRDLEIADPVGSSYIWIETPGRSYVAEVGYVDGDGTFVPLARSNPTWAPRAERPGTDPIRWMTVHWTGRAERTYPPIGAAPSVRSTAASARAVSSFDAEAGAPASDEHAGWHLPSTARRRTEPAPTNGRE